jgi:Tfp pilus assembly protein PilP
MTKLELTAAALSVAIALPMGAGAQAPAQPAAKAPAPANASAPRPDLPAPPANYEYTGQGRRDPFLSLVNRGVDQAAQPGQQPVKRLDGVPGLLTAEIVVKGIVLTRGAYVAMVAGADNKVYSIRAGDKVADGVVRAVTRDAVVILQEVNDPLSLEKQREVRKLLRGGEEVK